MQAQDNNRTGTVAAFTDHELDKYSLMERVLSESRFLEVLEQKLSQSGKDRKDFCIAIKPSISMLLRRNDVGTYTDPFLVVHLLRLLIGRGFTRLAVVESQNLYGNWFGNRGVAQVAARAGYLDESVPGGYQGEPSWNIRVRGGGVDALVPLFDLTIDKEVRDLGEPAGKIEVGRAWVDADFRISFPKLKTHFFSRYTLGIKNVYGCLPAQDKVREYHHRRVVGAWTASLIRAFPVDFCIADAYTAADGWFGVKMKAVCRKPHTLLAGDYLLAVDRAGADLMGIDAGTSTLYQCLAMHLPERPFKVAGNAGRFRPWKNAPALFAWISRLIERWASIMDFAGSLATGGHDPCFPKTLYGRGVLRKAYYLLTVPANTMFDIGVVRLRVREAVFRRRLERQGERMPLVAGSRYLIERLMLMAADDIRRLGQIMGEGGLEEVGFSGHYIFTGGREVPFPARLTIANLAAIEIMRYAAENGIDPRALSAELMSLAGIYPQLFGPGEYPYCYR